MSQVRSRVLVSMTTTPLETEPEPDAVPDPDTEPDVNPPQDPLPEGSLTA